MRRVALAAVAVAVALAGCGSGGGVSLPSVTLPTTLPSVTLPTVQLPAVTLPTREDSTPALTGTSTTERPATVTVTQTDQPTSTATPQPPLPAPSTGPSPWLWLLVALVVLAVVGLIVWLVRRARPRSGWDERMAAARQEAGWVEDSLVAQVTSRATTAEAAATWGAARTRLLALDASIHALATDPDPARAAAATQLRERLTALVDAVDADTTTGVDASVDDLRRTRAAVASARAGLRSLLTPARTQA